MKHRVEYEELLRRILALDLRVRTIAAVGGSGFTALTGDVTASGTGSVVATIANDAVTNAKLANMAQSTIKGRAAAAGTGDPTDLTPDQASTVLDGATDPFVRRSARTATLGITIDGGGVPITTGIKGDLEVPAACTITRVTMLADQSGSIVVDIWKDSYANFPPDNSDSITAAATPTISAATKSQDSTLTGWTTAIAAGAILRFNVDSAATIQRLQLQLEVSL